MKDWSCALNTILPTGAGATGQIVEFYDSLTQTLEKDTDGQELRLLQYAVTLSGWEQLSESISSWQKAKTGRAVLAFVGTDHAMTDPDALRTMIRQGIDVHLLVEYVGVFHPKVVWLVADHDNVLWSGSNNFTQKGLINNIECASVLSFRGGLGPLTEWYDSIRKASLPATDELIDDYEKQRNTYKWEFAKHGTFTWDRRTESSESEEKPRPKRTKPGRPVETLGLAQKGDLILEIMPRETSDRGNQVQIPARIATSFFRLPLSPGSSRSVRLSNIVRLAERSVTMTRYRNDTARLTIRELEFDHRPCLILFRKSGTMFQFEIVQKAIFPLHHRLLLSRCGKPTRIGSRRFGVLT